MAGRKTLAIAERQFEVLTLLWEHGPMTRRELLDHRPDADRTPYTTVLGLLQNMERSGLVTHDAEGTAHRYRPIISRHEATRTLLGDFLGRFFRGSAERLVLGLIDSKQLTSEELRAIEAKLSEAERKKADAKSPRTRRQR